MKKLLVSSCVVLLAGCATWSTSQVQSANNGAAPAVLPAAARHRQAMDVLVTEGDLTNKKYKVIGDIDVTVNKTTLFHPDPTRELVNEQLKTKAAELGADAVIQVRYGTVGISFVSWGSLNGKGRAVAFVE